MWKIKDPTLKEKINHLLSDEIVAQGCNRQMDNNFDYILLSCGEVDIKLKKESFENVPEYNPDGWNPFPALRPPRPGNYLVYLNGRFEHQIRVSYFNTDFRSWDQYSGAAVLAFRELEIEPPDDDILKFSAYKRE
jgi:hypothetical protein